MAELKTKPTGEDVEAYLGGLDEPRRTDCLALLAMMRDVTGVEPKLWGGSMVGFGDYHYRYASGHEGDTFVVGFAPRKQALTLYLTCGFQGQEERLARLGKHTLGKCCLYLKRLADADPPTLRELLRDAYDRGRSSAG